MSLKRRLKARTKVSSLSGSMRDKGDEISIEALDISMDGLAVKCSTIERDQLTPKGDFVCNGKPLEMDVIINLPEKNKVNYVFKAKCRVVYSSRLTQDECQLGMYFVEIKDSAKERLSKFIEIQA